MKISLEEKNKWSCRESWTSICTNLCIEATDGKLSSTEVPCSQNGQSAGHREQLREKGYSLVDETMPLALVAKLRSGIEQLRKHGLPASFIILFDETWELARVSRRLLRTCSADTNAFHFDILAWCIEDGGFSPHRDRQPEDAKATFSPDGDAKFITNWIALTPATPENSCLYMIPKSCDPGYMAGDNDDKDPLQRALPNKQAFQNIVAMPREPGQSILFTHRIIHWGSLRTAGSEPRIAISFVCSDPSFEQPYIDPSYFTDSHLPPFSIRLLLVCAQLLIYYQRFDLSVDSLKACYEYCKSNEDELETSYRTKVFVEYVKAMKEHKVGEFDDSEEEAMMEAMIDAEHSGYGEFKDDFDEFRGDEVAGDRDDDLEDFEEEDEVDLFGSAVRTSERNMVKRSSQEEETILANKKAKSGF